MLSKILSLFDFLAGLFYLLFSFGLIESYSTMVFFGIYLIIKAGIFILSLDIASIVDFIFGIFLIFSFFGTDIFLSIIVFIWFSQKLFFSFVNGL